MGTSWSIIVFLYNEEGTIESTLQSIEDIMQRIAPDIHEIIIVNDGSTDASHERILHYLKNGKTSIIYKLHSKNLGIGQALKTGYCLASKENVCAVPGDGQFDLQELLLCPEFTDNQFVSYCRKKTNYNLYRTLLSQFNKFINYFLLGVKMNDVNWIKVYKKSQLSNITFELKSLLIESEICAKLFAQKMLCIEIESKYLTRTSGSAKGGSLKTVTQAIFDLSKLIIVVWRYKF